MNDTPENAQVVGLYSFPKSGNTWLRAIVAGLTHMPNGPGVLQKYVTDTHFGKVLENPWHFQDRDWYFYKSHHKTLLLEHEGEVFDTHKVLYIYRHPLDVFMSYVNFVSTSVSPKAGQSLPFQYENVEDLTPEQMDELFQIFLQHATLFPKNKAFGGVFEHLANFRKLKEENGNVMILRYEDLHDDFANIAHEIVRFLGMDRVNVKRAFKTADQRTAQNGKFFWKRQKNNYLNFLTNDQINLFYDRHGNKLADMGYDRPDLTE